MHSRELQWILMQYCQELRRSALNWVKTYAISRPSIDARLRSQNNSFGLTNNWLFQSQNTCCCDEYLFEQIIVFLIVKRNFSITMFNNFSDKCKYRYIFNPKMLTQKVKYFDVFFQLVRCNVWLRLRFRGANDPVERYTQAADTAPT